ncbi:hypothetical protein B296_00005618 [Ensete ventricosum]|uniref:Uncharacterized protein n=1 Tax=Ensete ventricosum TaxID=4639 RepID=A0A427A6I2_ENSVE|nr:hypothetical protein B296_00005618 [Ensete ventricosum]
MRTGGNQDGPTAVRRGLNRPPPRAAPSLIPTTGFLASPPSSQPSYPSPTAPVTSGAVPTNTDLRHSPQEKGKSRGEAGCKRHTGLQRWAWEEDGNRGAGAPQVKGGNNDIGGEMATQAEEEGMALVRLW